MNPFTGEIIVDWRVEFAEGCCNFSVELLSGFTNSFLSCIRLSEKSNERGINRELIFLIDFYKSPPKIFISQMHPVE